MTLPRQLQVSDPAFPGKMLALTRQVLEMTPPSSAEAYFDRMFRLEMLTGQYDRALRHLDSFALIYNRAGHPGGTVVFIQYRAYLLTVLGGAAPGTAGFADAYTTRLAALYEAAPHEARSAIHRYFPPDTATAKEFMLTQLREVAGKKKVPIAAAERLLRSYLGWNLYRQVLHRASAYLDSVQARRYVSSDTTVIRLPDGGSLAALVVRPADSAGPLPVVLVYNIYASHSDLAVARSAADRGYVGIVVNTRGKRLSTDSLLPFEHDAEDAWHAIDWISRQPWCNGRIGMYGGSYLGFAQWSAVKRLHPALKTIVPQAAVGAGIDFPMQNGIFSSYMLRWIHYVNNNRFTDGAEFENQQAWNQRYINWYRSGRSFRALDSSEGRPSALFQRWLAHPDYDAYWQRMTPTGNEFAALNIPVLTITGYFDSDQQGALHYAREHIGHNPAAAHYLLIGPYDHGGAQFMPADTVGGYGIDSVAKVNIRETVFDWFNYTLRDGVRPAILRDRVVYQPMGTNAWRGAASLQALSNDSLVFHLGSENSDNELSSTVPARTAAFEQKLSYRPKRYSAINPRVLSDKLPPSAGLVFTSKPLDEAVLMNGSLEGELVISINKQDVDLKAELYELRPDGSYFRLSTFAGRASYMHDRSRRQLLKPGAAARIPILNADMSSKLLAKGSRIVLVLGVNNSPWAQVNYGTGKDVSDETAADGKDPLRISWGNQSRIRLPVLRDRGQGMTGAR